MPTYAPGLLPALIAVTLITVTRDAITWRSYRAFRLPFGVTVAVGREWR